MLEYHQEGQASYVFNIVSDTSTANYTFIRALGKENHRQDDERPYYWECRRHESFNTSICILQYTVSGSGMLEIGNKLYRQTEGDFFLIERPGPYRYWLPENSDHWEIKFLEFSVTGMPIWNGIVQSFGRVFNMNSNTALMRLWDEILEETASGKIDSLFKNSMYAYRMLLTLHQYLTEYGTQSPNTGAVQQCIKFIEENYAQDITLAEIAGAGGLSPFYINKAFKTVLGDTPIKYLTKIRIRRAMSLLCDTDMSIDEIAKKCGFQNANYFAKVFRRYVNTSPTDFRKQEMLPIIL